MPPKERVLTVRVDVKLSEGLEAVRERYGTPLSEQVRRALALWLEGQGVLKADRSRSAKRKRS